MRTSGALSFVRPPARLRSFQLLERVSTQGPQARAPGQPPLQPQPQPQAKLEQAQARPRPVSAQDSAQAPAARATGGPAAASTGAVWTPGSSSEDSDDDVAGAGVADGASSHRVRPRGDFDDAWRKDLATDLQELEQVVEVWVRCPALPFVSRRSPSG